jgi:hypothetical protein
VESLPASINFFGLRHSPGAQKGNSDASLGFFLWCDHSKSLRLIRFNTMEPQDELELVDVSNSSQVAEAGWISERREDEDDGDIESGPFPCIRINTLYTVIQILPIKGRWIKFRIDLAILITSSHFRSTLFAWNVNQKVPNLTTFVSTGPIYVVYSSEGIEREVAARKGKRSALPGSFERFRLR